MFGEAGNDRMIWNPGEGSDLNEGGAGIDTVEVNGGNGAETFTVTPNGTRVRFDRIDPAPFSIDIGTTENLVLNANGGDDTFTAGNGLAPLIQLTVDGGAGNDTITGGDGNDADRRRRQRHHQRRPRQRRLSRRRRRHLHLESGRRQRHRRRPGRQRHDGVQRLRHIRNLRSVGQRRAVRVLPATSATLSMDINGVEQVNVNALGGADTIIVNDLSGTDVTKVNLNSESTPGSGSGDLLADTVNVNGTAGADSVQIQGSGSSFSVSGLACTGLGRRFRRGERPTRRQYAERQ